MHAIRLWTHDELGFNLFKGKIVFFERIVGDLKIIKVLIFSYLICFGTDKMIRKCVIIIVLQVDDIFITRSDRVAF